MTCIIAHKITATDEDPHGSLKMILYTVELLLMMIMIAHPGLDEMWFHTIVPKWWCHFNISLSPDPSHFLSYKYALPKVFVKCV